MALSAVEVTYSICCKCSAVTLEIKPCWQSFSLNSQSHLRCLQQLPYCKISMRDISSSNACASFGYTGFYLPKVFNKMSSHIHFTKGGNVCMRPKNMSFECTTRRGTSQTRKPIIVYLKNITTNGQVPLRQTCSMYYCTVHSHTVSATDR